MSTIQIKSAFGEDNKGFVLKIAEPHSKKNEQGGYDTISRTFFDVKVRKDSGIDLSQFEKGQRIQVEGRLMTDVREYEGKKFYTLLIWADKVAYAEQGGAGGRSQPQTGQSDTWGNQGAQASAQSVAEQWAGNTITPEVPF